MNESIVIQETMIIAVVCICVTALIIAVMYFNSKHKIESHRTLQRVLESNAELTPEIRQLISKRPQNETDRRRGIFLMCISVVTAVILFFIGGNAWLVGCLPFAIGCIYFILSKTRSA